MSNEVLRFELRRQSDDLVYSLTRMDRADGSVGFKRADGDRWIAWMPDRGSIAWTNPRTLARDVPGTCCPGTRVQRRRRATG